MSRLHLQIWLTVLASLLVFAIAAGALWRVLNDASAPPGFDLAAEVVQGALPPADAPRESQADALSRLSAGGRIQASLFAPTRERIASVGEPLPPPGAGHDHSGWGWNRRGPPGVVLDLPDGRTLVARVATERQPARAFGFFATLALLALAVGAGAYPVVRRLTRRLERLKVGVEALGEGDLATRVPVEGRDEVAALARSFNRSAERIEELVGAHKALLANASHELRSPLARIRMALEMLGSEANPALRAEVERDIGELDALIDEILLASRLDAAPETTGREAVDLLALAAEESARVGAALEGAPLTLDGDARLLRRMIRNLLENAKRHGGGTAVDVDVRGAAGTATIRVCDRGPGVAEAERERIFEPFYRLAGASEAQGGAGLGLSLVRQIARHHGGDVRCLARNGGGSCFEVTLPVRG
jgi:signal transduction histidine kinase